MEKNNVTEITVKRELAKSQIVAEAKLPASGATKVLGADASLSLAVTECFSGEVRVSGTESISIMFLTADGAEPTAAAVDFTDRIECRATAATRAKVSGRVLDTDIVAIEADGVRLASVIEITVWELVTFSLPSPEMPEGVFGNEKHIKCSSLAAAFSAKTVIESDEIFKAETLLSASGRVTVSAAEAALDSVMVSGEVIIDACGASGDGMASGEIMIPFVEEIPASGARAGDIAAARACVCKVGSVETDGGFSFAVTVQLDGEVYCRSSVDVVADAFSTSHALSREEETVSLSDVKASAFVSERADGSVTLAEGDSADSVIALAGFEFLSENVYISFGKVVVEGALSGTIAYFDAEAAARKTVNALIPVKVSTSVDAEEGDEAQAAGSVGKISVKLRRSGEIDIKADVLLNVVVSQSITEKIISGISAGDMLEAAGGAISVYIASESESLWDCAKALRVKPETLTVQNPALNFPLRRGEKVIIFRDSGQ